jgi:hypothetical protein
MRIAWLVISPLLGLLVALPASAQVKIGENLSVGMDGTLGFGYGADYASGQSSSTGVALSGMGSLHGYYFDPRFLTFTVSPSYNRSQSNTQGEGGSLTNSSSIGVNFGIFGGSHFPGSISWTKTFGSSGTYQAPGVQGFVTRGDTTNLSVGWSALVPNLPPVSFNYNQQSSNSTIFGSSQEDHSTSRSFNVQSNYRWHGWPINGHLGEIFLNSGTPSFFSSGGETSGGGESALNASISTSHKLPMNGGLSMNYGYGRFSGGPAGDKVGGSDDGFAISAGFLPWRRFSTQFQFQYQGNLQSQVENQLVSAGSVAPQVNLGSNSHTLSFSNSDSLYLPHNFSLAFNASRIQQVVYKTNVAEDSYSVIANYRFQKPLWGTMLFYAGVNDLASNGQNQGASLNSGANFSRRIKAWELSGNFSYSQGVQTVVALITTSNYSFNAGVARDLTRRLRWFANFNEFHSGFSQTAGISNYIRGVSSSLLYRNFALAANYSESVGASLITANGLIATPGGIPTSLLGSNQYLQSTGKSYSVSTSGVLRHVIVAGAYTHTEELTSAPSVNTDNLSSVYFVNASYPWRKMGFTAGFSHISQSVGAPSGAPANYSSYYIGIQRWFKPF